MQLTYIGNKLTLRRTGIKGKNRKVTPMSKGKKSSQRSSTPINLQYFEYELDWFLGWVWIVSVT